MPSDSVDEHKWTSGNISVLFFEIMFCAFLYSVIVNSAVAFRLPSALFTIIKSAISIIPFFIP